MVMIFAGGCGRPPGGPPEGGTTDIGKGTPPGRPGVSFLGVGLGGMYTWGLLGGTGGGTPRPVGSTFLGWLGEGPTLRDIRVPEGVVNTVVPVEGTV